MIKYSIFSAILALGLTTCSSPSETAAPDYVPPDYKTASIDLSTPQGTAYAMMIAMYRGEAESVDQVFLQGARLSRVKADGTTELDGLKRWRDWVGTLEVGQAHEEIFGLKVEQFENLATVWAPFVITFDGKIVGCGVNQLSMAKQQDKWRIVSGLDTPAPKGSCETFKESYL